MASIYADNNLPSAKEIEDLILSTNANPRFANRDDFVTLAVSGTQDNFDSLRVRNKIINLLSNAIDQFLVDGDKDSLEKARGEAQDISECGW